MTAEVSGPVALFAISCALLISHAHTSSDMELLPYEPVQYLKAQLPPAQPTPLTKYITEATPTQAADFMTKAKALLKSHLGTTGTSAALIRGEKVLVQRRAKDVKWDTKIQLPYSNVVSLMSAVLPILLEGYKGSTLRDPIGKVLRGKDREHSLVTGRESLSFLDLINKLPSVGKGVNLESPSLLSSLSASGELASHFVNAVLGGSAHEAWMDAIMALGSMGIKRTESGRLVLDMSDLLQSSLTVTHDFSALGAVPRREAIPLDDDKYLFGWWFNCPKATPTQCLIPHAPADTVFSLSPDLRLYISPSLELTLIVLGPGATSGKSSKSPGSLADILITDGEIWRQFVLAVESPSEEGVSQRPDDDVGARETRSEDQASADSGEAEETVDGPEDVESAEESAGAVEDNDLVALIHWVWPILVFMFWVTSSHVWFYWMIYVIWFCLTKVNSRTHIPRPRTAAENRS